MRELVRPHGGELSPLLVDDKACEQLASRAAHLPKVALSAREASDLAMLATGSFSPLRGFMTQADYLQVVEKMRLADGWMWPIPITLSATESEARQLKGGSEAALVDARSGATLGIMTVEEVFAYDRHREAVCVFGTDDRSHPGVASLYEQDGFYLGGSVHVLSEGDYPQRFPEYARPAETRRIFKANDWTTVAAFQTRNPMHRSHEYLTKIALEICDGVLIHPVVGDLKQGDIPAEVRMDCYRALLGKYFPMDRTVLRVYPMKMRYAGPREALLHAIIRQNFGCSHLIIGRDHAGVGDYYGPFDAQNIFDTLAPDDLQIQPLKLDWTFWCNKCDAMASMKTCPHGKNDRLLISGTRLRDMLSRGVTPPEHFSRPEVIEILLKYYAMKGGAK